jgi:hypothetical protein
MQANNKHIKALATLLFITCIFGYTTVATISEITGYENRIFSIFLRSFIIFLTTILIYKSRKTAYQSNNKIALVLLIIFWSIYITRIAFYFAIDPNVPAFEISFYYTWAIGVSFLPMLALALAGGTTNAAISFTVTFYFAAASSLLALSQAGTQFYEEDVLISHGRLMLQHLNPISLGRHAAILIVLSVWAILHRKELELSRGTHFFAHLTLLAGMYLLLGSGSRGPLLSLFATMLFIVALDNKTKTTSSGIAVIAIGAIIYFATMWVVSNEEMSIYRRLSSSILGSDEATNTRYLSFSGAMSVFLEDPLFGGAIEEPNTNFYPHNVYLEVLMTTGLVGATPLLVAVTYMFKVSVLRLKHRPKTGWIGALLILHLGDALFAGSIYNSGQLWALIGTFFIMASSKVAYGNETHWRAQ